MKSLSEWRWEILAVVVAFGIGVLLGIALPAGDTKQTPTTNVVIVDRNAERPPLTPNGNGGTFQVGRVTE